MHADSRTGKQQDSEISDKDMNRCLVYSAASVGSAERRTCNKAFETIELIARRLRLAVSYTIFMQRPCLAVA